MSKSLSCRFGELKFWIIWWLHQTATFSLFTFHCQNQEDICDCLVNQSHKKKKKALSQFLQTAKHSAISKQTQAEKTKCDRAW